MSTELVPKVPIEANSYEVLPWRPKYPEIYSRAEVLRQTGDYRPAIPAEIAELSPQLPNDFVAMIEDASNQIVAFDREAQMKLGLDSPALGPMSAILLRTESTSSSQIEQLTTSAKQLALAELNEESRSNARTVVGNVRAMEAALELAAKLDEKSVLEMHQALMSHQFGFSPKDAGVYREEQVWIGKGKAGPRLAEFVAPHHSRINKSMKDLMIFLNREDLPVLAQAALGHAQFETIHPFADGNGRTGRALVQSLLKNKGLVSSSALPISAGLLIDTESYFDALTAFRSGDAGPIIFEFAKASQFAAVTGIELINKLANQLQLSREKLEGVRKDAAAWMIIPALISQPVINSKYLIQTLGLGEMAALRALDVLAERGVITELTGWRRSRVWEHAGILGVLDDYAAVVRRNPAHNS